MSTAETLIAKLRASAAAESLRSERSAAAILGNAGWYVTHGVYYEDLASAKTREVDVVATRRWFRESGAGTSVTTIKLVVECKSLQGWHLLFSPSLHPLGLHALERWSVDDPAIGTHIVTRLAHVAADGDALWQLRKGLTRGLVRKDRPGEMCPAAPAAAVSVSAFRETNIGSDKDVDSSVLWKAAQSLTSAIAAFKREETNARAAELESEFEHLRTGEPAPADEIVQRLAELVGYVETYHPIIVTGSHMWLAQGDHIEPLNWCRFELTQHSSGTRGWHDVVFAPAFAEYVMDITAEYDSEMKKLFGARADEPAA